MTEYKNSVPGTFCWVELQTANLEAAVTFYGGLLGWNFSDAPGPQAYKIGSSKAGWNNAGLTMLSDEAKKMGAPPNWLAYVAVKDADASAKKATSMGGKALAGPFEMGGMGKMAILQDPTGAVFAIWQEQQSMGTFPYQEVGALSWNELSTTDVDRAGKFYSDLFGWQSDAIPMPGMTYTTFKQGEKYTGGMMPQPKEMKGAPSMWTVYLEVADADASAKKVESLGGKSFGPLMDVPNVGRFGFFADPQGAMFALIKSTQQPAK